MVDKKVEEIVQKINKEFRKTSVCPIDARKRKNPLEYVQSIETELTQKGYEILTRLKDPDEEVYHLHLRGGIQNA